MRHSWLVFLALFFLAGCSLSQSYVTADQATYDAVADEYLAYVDSDTRLTPERRDRRHETVRSWKARLDAAAGAK